MKTTWIATLLLLGACGGGNYCEQQAKWAEDCGTTVSDADLDACEQMLEGCSGSDQKKLSDYSDCVIDAGLYGCGDETESTTTGELMEMMEAIVKCSEPVADVSQECLDGMGLSVNFSDYSTFQSSTY